MKTLAILFSLLLALSSPAYSFSEWGESWALADQGVTVPTGQTTLTKTFGWLLTPTSSSTQGSQGTQWIIVTPDVTGTIVKISFSPYANGDDTLQAAIYSGDFQTRLQLSETTYSSSTAGEWYDFVVNLPCTALTSYSVAVSASGAYNFGRTSGTSFNRYVQNGVQCPDEPLVDDTPDSGYAIGVYITVEYTA